MEYGAVVVWWALLVLLGAVGTPLTATLLRPLPDRGAALALPTALAVIFLAIYWLGQLHYGPVTVAIGAVALAGLSAAVARRSPPVDRGRLVEWSLIFTASFLLLVAVRASDPAVVPGGGEKFLDYGLVRSLLRADALPPEDIWFAGEPVAYYYGGHLLAASLATLTGVPTRLAYNLALAGVYATLVAGAYGLAGSLAATRDRSYRVGGALGAFFVGVASNVVPLVQAVVWILPAPFARSMAAGVASRTAVPAERLLSPETFHYWTASRVIPVTVNEFPLFAFVNGDLHAHMSSQPFLLLVIGVCAAYYLTPPEALRRRRLLLVGALPALGGVVVLVNTWSLPAVAGLAGLSVLFARAPARELLPGRIAEYLPAEGAAGELGQLGVALLVSMLVGLVSVAWALPFALRRVASTGGGSLGIGLFPDRTGLLAFVLVHGWYLLVFALYLASRSAPLSRHRDTALAGTAAVVVLGVLGGAAAVAVVGPLLGIGWYLLRRSEAVGYETVLLVAGAGLLLVVEFAFVDEQAGPGRFNTVFKTYAQVWLLWALGAGAALAALLPRRPDLPTGRGVATVALAVLLVAAASLYGFATVGGHLADSTDPTLDATTWASTAQAEEWPAIRYLDRRPGQPVVVTAPGCACNPQGTPTPYTWANAPSTFAGLPTVAGWNHVVGYRGHDPYLRRVEDVRTIYTGPREARERLLERYDVRYVYVGPGERALYGEVAVGQSPALVPVFRNGAVTIYEVRDG